MRTKKKRKRTLTHEQAVLKAICRAQREAVGFTPAITQRNRRRHFRAEQKARLRTESGEGD